VGERDRSRTFTRLVDSKVPADGTSSDGFDARPLPDPFPDVLGTGDGIRPGLVLSQVGNPPGGALGLTDRPGPGLPGRGRLRAGPRLPLRRQPGGAVQPLPGRRRGDGRADGRPLRGPEGRPAGGRRLAAGLITEAVAGAEDRGARYRSRTSRSAEAGPGGTSTGSGSAGSGPVHYHRCVDYQGGMMILEAEGEPDRRHRRQTVTLADRLDVLIVLASRSILGGLVSSAIMVPRPPLLDEGCRPRST
jgi:hypothetical protein